MMDIALVEVDFDDPTTNVRGRRALAIAKPTPRGYWPRRSTINLTTKVYSYKQSKNEQEYDKGNLNIANIYEVLIKVGIRKRSWSGRWTQTKYTKLQWLTFN